MKPASQGQSHVRMNATAHGFTLIEVMFVVTLMAVLVGVALPYYGQYVQRGHRAHARAALLQAAQWLERAATAQGAYPDRAAVPHGVLHIVGDRYTMDFKSLSASTFVLRATPIAAQGDDRCGIFELSETGAMTQAPSPLVAKPLTAQVCWNR